jgi:hypothetical protein
MRSNPETDQPKQPVIAPAVAMTQLNRLINRGDYIIKNGPVTDPAERAWTAQVVNCLEQAFGRDSSFLQDFWPPGYGMSSTDAERAAGLRAKSMQFQVDYLRELVAAQPLEIPTDPIQAIAEPDLMELFICHSAEDEDLASAFIDLVRSALSIPPKKIRCTSVDGYKLSAGDDFESKLRSEVLRSTIFVALLTPSVLDSTFVHFELGARWGSSRALRPIMAKGLKRSQLDRPLSSLHMDDGKREGEILSLIDIMGTDLGREPVNTSAFLKEVKAFNTVAAKSSQPQSAAPTFPVAAANLANESKFFRSDDVLWKAVKDHTGSYYKLYCPTCEIPVTRTIDFVSCPKCGFQDIKNPLPSSVPKEVSDWKKAP